MSAVVRALVATCACIVALTACTAAQPEPADEQTSAAASSPSSETAPPRPGPKPKTGACHDLTFRQAVAVVGRTAAVACTQRHTAQTFFVGRLDLRTKAGFTRRVDSQAAQRQMRKTCTARLPRHLAQEPGDLRLSMAQTVWFTPSPKRAEAGADWFRCDVVVVASPKRLMQLPRRTKGWGGDPAIGMCATAAPGTPGFRRVVCDARHAWRATTTIDLPGAKLPTQAAIVDRMESPCEDSARAQADDPLDFTWSQESPTQEQWDAGQHYGICWVPAGA